MDLKNLNQRDVMGMSAAVILAGGKSRRMGRDKLTLELGGETLLESAISRFSEEFNHVYLSVADIEKYSDIDIHKIVDLLPGAGPLSGLHAALSTIPGEGLFLVAADLPYSNPKAAMKIITLCGEKEAGIIKLPDGKIEPLFGYYRKTLLARCEKAIASGDFRMTELIASADVRYVAPDELGELWDEKMILNINYPGDYEKIRIS